MGFGSKLKEFFLGGTSEAIGKTAEGVANIVEKWHPGEVKKQEMELEINRFLQDSYESARKHDSPMDSGMPLLDALVNGVNRLIRPWVTITVIGSLFGYWELPPPQSIDPAYWTITQIILGFWFGGRFLVKDIPQAVKGLLK